MIPMLKLKPEVKALWLEAFRSGEYEQTTGQLKKTQYDYNEHLDSSTAIGVGFCCLGVLCDIAPKELGQWGGCTAGRVESVDAYITPTSHDNGVPARVVMEWAFENYDDEVHAAHRDVPLVEEPFESLDGDDLAGLNDSGSTFLQIADIIQEKL